LADGHRLARGAHLGFVIPPQADAGWIGARAGERSLHIIYGIAGEHDLTERDAIRDAVLTRGWSEARQAYAQSFDSDELDAAQLLMPILGFLPATDARMRSTIDAIADDLTEDGLVLRYRNEEGLNADGLTGEEGTFVICSFLCTGRASTRSRARIRRCRGSPKRPPPSRSRC
jgi:hypothetical protein